MNSAGAGPSSVGLVAGAGMEVDYGGTVITAALLQLPEVFHLSTAL
jgi:hypothetical protein